MPMIEINKNPSRTELNWFGVLFAAFFALVGGLVFWQASERAAYVIWAVAAAVVVLYYALPPMRRPLYLGWMYAALPIGWTVSHLLLAAVYYLLFTPIGLVLRLTGHDPLHRRIDRDATTYWIEHPTVTDPARYFRQF